MAVTKFCVFALAMDICKTFVLYLKNSKIHSSKETAQRKMYLFEVFLCILVFVRETMTIKGGSSVAMCDYPGIAAIVSGDTNTVLCSGLTQAGNVLLIPELCKIALTKQVTVSDVYIKYGNGDNTITLTKGSSPVGSVSDGVWKLQLPSPLGGPCKDPPPPYKSGTTKIDKSSCQIVGFGANVLASEVYNKAGLHAAPITKSTSTSCCNAINFTIPHLQYYIVDQSAPLNCLTSPGAPCSVADIGAPIYCNRDSGGKVVIGLTGSAPCEAGKTFVVHDLTSSDPNVKFGIPPLK